MAVRIPAETQTKGVSIRTLHDITGEKFRWVLEIEQGESFARPPSQFTTMLMHECQSSASVADKLLALEAWVREIEKANGVEQP